MLDCGMGTGKSRMTIDVLAARRPDVTLVVAPARVVSVWPRQFSYHSQPGDFQLVRLDAMSNKDATELLSTTLAARSLPSIPRSLRSTPRPPVVFIINYEQIWREPLLSYLTKQRPLDALILDESHRAKTADGRTAKGLAQISPHVPLKMALTGTPIPHSPLDIFAQFRILDPGVFGPSYHRFKMDHAILGGFQRRQVVGYKDLPLLKKKMDVLAFHVDRNVLSLPPALHEERSTQLAPAARRVYDRFEADFYVALSSGEMSTNNTLTRLLRLQQMTSGYATVDGDSPSPSFLPSLPSLPSASDPDDFQRPLLSISPTGARLEHIDTAKEDLLLDILTDIPPDEPVVIFCQFTPDLDAVHRVAATLRRASMELSGRRDEWEAWQDGLRPDSTLDPSVPPIIAVQMQAGGSGVDLTRARYCIYYSVGYSLGNYLQSEARVHRPGQTRPVFYIHLVVKNSVDEKVRRSLADHRSLVDEIMSWTP